MEYAGPRVKRVFFENVRLRVANKSARSYLSLYIYGSVPETLV